MTCPVIVHEESYSDIWQVIYERVIVIYGRCLTGSWQVFTHEEIYSDIWQVSYESYSYKWQVDYESYSDK